VLADLGRGALARREVQLGAGGEAVAALVVAEQAADYNIVRLVLSLSARILINDGQPSRAGDDDDADLQHAIRQIIAADRTAQLILDPRLDDPEGGWWIPSRGFSHNETRPAPNPSRPRTDRWSHAGNLRHRPHPLPARSAPHRRGWLGTDPAGLLLRPIGDVVYFMPPYVITDDEVDWALDQLVAVLTTALRHPNEATSDVVFLKEAVGRLWVAGIEIDPTRFFAPASQHRVSLPT